MIQIEADGAIEKVREISKTLSKTQMNRGISRALNNTASQGRTVARKAVSDLYNIPQKNLSSISLVRSTAATLKAQIIASTKPIPLISFSPKFDMPTKSIRATKRGKLKVRNRRRKTHGKGVSIEIYKGQRQTIRFAFMTTRITAVFARGKYISTGFEKRTKRTSKDGNDLPIQALASVTIHTAVTNNKTLNDIQRKVTRILPAEIEREIRYRLSKVKT